MDFAYASGSLSVKIAELKRLENQLTNLGNKTNEEIVEFLNHLQIAGNAELKSFGEIIIASEQSLFKELKSLLNEDYYYLLDLVYADEVLTFLNLTLNKVKYEDKFKAFDYIHISLASLLLGEMVGMQEHYGKIITQVTKQVSEKGRKQEALLTKLFYEHLATNLENHPFLLAKQTMINLRSLYRSKKLELSAEDYKIELLGDDTNREKFLNLYRLEDKQIVSALKDKFDVKASSTYEHIINNERSIDKYLDKYLADKVANLMFSTDFIDLFIFYSYQYRRIIKELKKIYYRVEKYEANRNN